MRVLVTGAHGFLGRHVAWAFREAGAQVVSAPPSGEFDLIGASDAALDSLIALARPDVLVNCAGRTSGSTAQLSAANHLLVARLIDAAQRQPAAPRLLHLGSAAELGPAQTEVVSETHPACPVSPYGATKLAGTELLMGAFARGELAGSVLRVFNPVGPGQGPESLPGGAARRLAQACRDGQAAVRFGPLDTYRDFIDARDVARAAVCAAHAGTLPPLMNVARGMAVLTRALVTELVELSGYQGQVEEDAAPSSRSAAVAYQQADISRLRVLGWTPRYRLQQALFDLWAEHVPEGRPEEPLAPLERSA